MKYKKVTLTLLIPILFIFCISLFVSSQNLFPISNHHIAHADEEDNNDNTENVNSVEELIRKAN
ncbi:hypothetical protein, partial [Staphylococcus pseudintermedius]